MYLAQPYKVNSNYGKQVSQETACTELKVENILLIIIKKW